MKTSTLMTAGAVAFAAFAAWYALRKPGQVASATPAQAQRDTGLADWLAQLNGQANQTSTAHYMPREWYLTNPFMQA